MWKNVVAIVVISLVLGLLWPNYFKSKTSEESEKLGEDRENKLRIEIQELQDQIKATTTEFATCKNLLEGSNTNSQKQKDKINKLEDQIKATTKDSTTCQRKLEDYNTQGHKLEIFKGEISKLQYEIKAATKEFSTCQNLLEDCNARSHISHEKSSDRFYGVIWGLLIVCVCLIVCCLCCVGCAASNSNKSYQRSNSFAITFQ